METESAIIAKVCPSPYGYAVFVRCKSKTFAIYMDKCGGSAVEAALESRKAERPGTHELMAYMLDGLDCKVRDVLVYHTNNGIFFARLALEMKNELGSKITELDSRPSDSFSLALRCSAPIYVAKSVLDKVQDVSDVLEKINKEAP